MQNPFLKEELIRAREEYTPVTSRRKKVKFILKKLRGEAEAIKKHKSGLSENGREWILDNFYLIEEAAGEIHGFSASKYPALIFITDVFAKNADSLDSESASFLFEILKSRNFVTDEVLEKVRSALIYSCLKEILTRCRECAEPGDRIELLRRVKTFDFSGFISGFSESERYLRADPSGTWQKMSRASKDLYKRKIRKMAKHQRVDFTLMCKMISEKAKESSRHIGEYIDFGEGGAWLYYVGFSIVFLLALSVSSLALFPLQSTLLKIFMLTALIPPLFETSQGIATFIAGLFKKGEILPRVEVDSVDQSVSTLVVIPALVTSGDEAKKLFSQLEELYLKSRSRKKEDTGLWFGLLLDLSESDSAVKKGDDEIIKTCREEVVRLNKTWSERFLFFTRPRTKDNSSGKYMAYERKRGALLELCRFVLNKRSAITSFGGNIPQVKYIVTLDSDTQMSMGDLCRMIGTMEHPLHTPELEEKDGVTYVKKGYGILQPVMTPSLSEAYKTPFSLLISGAGGFDIYHGPRFNLHHALHRRAMFCGKGIFNTACYLKVLENAFPDGIVLSHDMLEGSRLRAGVMTDMVFSDSVPGNIISYYKRAHRWARGDVQSLIFTSRLIYNRRGERVKNPQPLSDRFVFWSNLIFMLSPIGSVLALFLAMNTRDSGLLFLIAISPLWLYSALQLITSFKSFRIITLFRRFFTHAISGIARELVYFLYSLTSLFFRAFKNYTAIAASLWRMGISGKKLIEWNTAGQVEGAVKKGSLLSYFLYTLPSFAAGAAVVILSSNGFVRLTGFLWCIFFVVGYLSGKERKRKFALREKDKKKLYEYAEKSWKFFSESVSGEDNFLPCDNISHLPKRAKAHRTSPTNIGLYLISALAARDFGFIDSKKLAELLGATLDTVERLDKYRGHLYNWYDTLEAVPIGQRYISSVDSGNLAVCLVTLSSGVMEYAEECPELEQISRRAREIERGMDFRFLYDGSRKLFYIGYDTSKEEYERNYYDLYMSEARSMDYYAVARGIVEKEHWSVLSRSLTARHLLIGALSWSGTAFEYFMPHIFLPVFENSFADEALSFAFSEQVDYSSKSAKGAVWGISESGYFAFDRDLNYQYRAFGVPYLALSRESENERVISPYSTFLMLRVNLPLCLENLERLERLGMLGEWGFYEAVDFSPSRSGGGVAMVKSYMAHHVGMSICSMANIVFDEVFVKRFMKDVQMRSAVELLQERVPVDAVVLKKKRSSDTHRRVMPVLAEEAQSVCRNKKQSCPSLIIGKNECMVVGERGVSRLMSGDIALLRPVMRGELMSFLPYCKCRDGIFSPLSPEKSEFLWGRGMVRYRCDEAEITLNLSGQLSAARVRVESKTDSDSGFKGIYIQPAFRELSAFLSHPVYTDLFFEGDFDKEKGALFTEYRGKSPFYQCILSNREFEFEMRADRIFKGRERSSESLFDYIEKASNLSCGVGTLLFPCVLVRTKTHEKEASFFIGWGKSREEALRNAQGEKNKTRHESLAASDEHEKNLMAASGIKAADGMISQKLLSVFYSDRRIEDAGELSPPHKREELWRLGISGDIPIVTVSAELAREVLSKLFAYHKYHYISGLRYDLAVVCHDSGYNSDEHKKVYAAMDENKCRFIENLQGGIFVVGGEHEQLLKSACTAVIDSVEDLKVLPTPIPIMSCVNTRHTERSDKRAGFSDEGYTVDKESFEPELLWHHIIASDSFGTLISTRGLGHTWAYNSALFKLTLWENDPLRSLGGEKLYIMRAGRVIDACSAAVKTEFVPGGAVYRAKDYEIRVSINPRLLYKEVRVKLFFEGQVKLVYSFMPVMGDGVFSAGRIKGDKISCGLKFSNTFSDIEKKGFGYIVSPGENTLFDDSGLSLEKTVYFGQDVVFALGYAGGEEHFKRALDAMGEDSFEKSREFAKRFLPPPQKTSFDPPSEYMFNVGLPWQCAVSRVIARTGPYQAGGAFGARDQTQDMLFLTELCPERVRAHLFRVAAHQFEEGDVQHWWHGFRGTRTECSDDYLWFVLLLVSYVEKTGDRDIFSKKVSYLSSKPLGQGERERYELSQRSSVRENLLEHAERALNLFCKRGVGKMGLPFMGSGDWNDGMDMIGRDGGESVWLAFFAIIVFHKSFPLFESFGKDTSAWREFCAKIYESIEKNAYFTDRYARAFTAKNDAVGTRSFEGGCSIDGLVEAAASCCYHITGKGTPHRISASLDTAWRELYDSETRVYKLFSPAFREYNPSIGYVSAYPEGVRENGGQYTHGAVFAALGYLWAPGEKKKNFERCKKILDGILTCTKPLDVLKTEPYVLSADIYTNPSHMGRGGWSFYTGSAGWCRYLMEEILNEEKKQE